MSVAARLPGTSGNYFSTPDVNLLDADTAHLAQSQGQWDTVNPASGTFTYNAPATGEYGSFDFVSVNIAAFPRAVVTTGLPTLADGAHVFSVTAHNPDAGPHNVSVRVYKGGAFDETIETLQPGETRRLVLPFTVAGVAVSELRLMFAPGGNVVDGDRLRYSLAQIRTGSDGSFVPSLRIVGDLDMRARVAADDWTPAGSQYFISTRLGSFNGVGIGILNTGALFCYYADDTGADERLGVSSLITSEGAVNGEAAELKATFDQSAGRWDYFFDGASFDSDTGLSTNPGSGTLGSTELGVGSSPDGGVYFDGDIYWVEVRDGIDGPVVARFDAADWVESTS